MNLSQTKAPTWRYDEAKAILFMQQQQQSMPNTQDVVVALLCRIMTAERSKGAVLFIKNKMPQIYSIYELGAKQDQSPLRCQLQAAILCFQNNQQILKHVPWLSQLQLAFYKDAFFDVDKIVASPILIQQYLLQPARLARRFQLYNSRLLALQGGFRDALQSIPWGKITDKGQSIMKRHYKKAHVKRMLRYFLRDVNIDPVTQANIMNGHFTKQQDAQRQKELRSGASGDTGRLQEIARDMQKYVRGFTRQQRQHGADDPLDQANQTIRHIITADKEQKEASNEQ